MLTQDILYVSTEPPVLTCSHLNTKLSLISSSQGWVPCHGPSTQRSTLCGRGAQVTPARPESTGPSTSWCRSPSSTWLSTSPTMVSFWAAEVWANQWPVKHFISCFVEEKEGDKVETPSSFLFLQTQSNWAHFSQTEHSCQEQLLPAISSVSPHPILSIHMQPPQ